MAEVTDAIISRFAAVEDAQLPRAVAQAWPNTRKGWQEQIVSELLGVRRATTVGDYQTNIASRLAAITGAEVSYRGGNDYVVTIPDLVEATGVSP